MAHNEDASSLHRAAEANDVEALRRLLSQGGVDPNLPDPYIVEVGKTPLHHLCVGGNDWPPPDEEEKERSAICLELLRAAGADVNARNYLLNVPPYGCERPLHYAARGDPHLVQLLIESGANVEAESFDGRTPLHVVDSADAARMLLSAGAYVNANGTTTGYTPLEAAVHTLYGRYTTTQANPKIYPILLSAGATLPDPSFLQETAEPRTRSYLQRVIDEGGFANLARLHLNKLTETFAPKFAGRLPPEIVRHVVSFWLHAGYYDEGTEADETRYDSLIADITRKVAEMASLKGPRASLTAARLSAAFESDSEEDYYSD